ncbi:MAG: hypothetical protein HY902_10980 [Deltaproteobacteria bacterium]|nr:hypothetical protein [Deltaproteobacteria bacterium]
MNTLSPHPTILPQRWLALLTTWAALFVWSAPALAAPSDALNILRSVGQSGIAQDVGMDQAKKDTANQIAREAAQKTGAKVYVVLLKRDEDPGAYAEIYNQLGMQGKDLLIASNGTKWEVKCAGLSHDSKQAVVDRALKVQGLDPLGRLRELTTQMTTAINQQTLTVAGTGRMSWNEFQAANAGKGWSGARMSEEYARYKATGAMPGGGALTTTSTGAVPVVHSPSSNTGTWVFLSILVVAIVGVVLWRRKKRDASLGQDLKNALQGPEQVITDVYMTMDGLENHPRFGQLLEAANACQAKLDDLKKGPATREAIAKARALNDEANRVRRAFDDAKMQR